MRRRDFIVLVVGSATMGPPVVHAQHAQKISRIGVLLPGTPESFSLRTKAFLDGLKEMVPGVSSVAVLLNNKNPQTHLPP